MSTTRAADRLAAQRKRDGAASSPNRSQGAGGAERHPASKKGWESHYSFVAISGRAWAAGLFEGEGCFTRALRTGRSGGGGMRLAAALESTDEEVVRRFCAVVGCGRVYALRQRAVHYKPSWRWQLAGAKVEHVYDLLEPWLGERRRARYHELLAERRAYEATWGPGAEYGYLGGIERAA